MKKKKNKKKSKKKIIIGAAVILVAAGGIRVVGQKNAAENQTPQVPVVTAETGDVEEIVDASGIVGSEEEKTYYSPVNAELKTVSFSQGDVVKKGTKLIEFETENLEKDNPPDQILKILSINQRKRIRSKKMPKQMWQNWKRKLRIKKHMWLL